MSDTNQNTPIVEAENYKMTVEETVKTLRTYDTQAANTLIQLNAEIDKTNKQIAEITENTNKQIADRNKQINEWRKMQLMIVGQQQVLKDLLSKVTSPAKVVETSNSAETPVNNPTTVTA